MKNIEKHFALALVVLLIGVFLPSKMVCGQVIEVGPSVGLSYYMGDINPKMPLRQSSLGLGVVVRKTSEQQQSVQSPRTLPSSEGQ